MSQTPGDLLDMPLIAVGRAPALVRVADEGVAMALAGSLVDLVRYSPGFRMLHGPQIEIRDTTLGWELHWPGFVRDTSHRASLLAWIGRWAVERRHAGARVRWRMGTTGPQITQISQIGFKC